jgi:hypothetical protein
MSKFQHRKQRNVMPIDKSTQIEYFPNEIKFIRGLVAILRLLKRNGNFVENALTKDSYGALYTMVESTLLIRLFALTATSGDPSSLSIYRIYQEGSQHSNKSYQDICDESTRIYKSIKKVRNHVFAHRDERMFANMPYGLGMSLDDVGQYLDRVCKYLDRQFPDKTIEWGDEKIDNLPIVSDIMALVANDEILSAIENRDLVLDEAYYSNKTKLFRRNLENLKHKEANL